MAKTAVINVRVEPKIKKKSETLFAKFGITVSEAVNIFLHQAIYEGGLPFEMRREEPNALTLAAMDDAENDRNMSGPYHSVEELMEALNA